MYNIYWEGLAGPRVKCLKEYLLTVLQEDATAGYPSVVCRKCCNLIDTFFHFSNQGRLQFLFLNFHTAQPFSLKAVQRTTFIAKRECYHAADYNTMKFSRFCSSKWKLQPLLLSSPAVKTGQEELGKKVEERRKRREAAQVQRLYLYQYLPYWLSLMKTTS